MAKLSALLDAIKNTEKGLHAPLDDEDDTGKPIAAKLTVLKAKPLADKMTEDLIGPDDEAPPHDDDMMGGIPSAMSPMSGLMGGDMDEPDADDMGGSSDDDQDDGPSHDSAIVDALQEKYPELYARLSREVTKPDDIEGGV